jgi:hypothetical protein
MYSDGDMGKRSHGLTKYGLSFTAALFWTSATLRLASATRLARSSDMTGTTLGVPGFEAEAEDDDEGVATTTGELRAAFIAAIFAAISALFWTMSASADTYQTKELNQPPTTTTA